METIGVEATAYYVALKYTIASLRMDIRRVFGANVRHYRLAAHLSQEAMAERMGPSMSARSNVACRTPPC